MTKIKRNTKKKKKKKLGKLITCHDPEDRNSLKSCHKKNKIKTIIVIIEKKNRNYTLLMKRSGLFAKMFNTSLS